MTNLTLFSKNRFAVSKILLVPLNSPSIYNELMCSFIFFPITYHVVTRLNFAIYHFSYFLSCRTVPQVLVKCITELERRGGLMMEGVYRVPGNQEIVEDFRIALDKGSSISQFVFQKYMKLANETSDLIPTGY
ncbi:unnamed protein product [Hymenolepis diminuta]|uniref:Rho-GAP domain-containing protein n=1 Tax=Hymenolepis diminuta TaxID=6216 RepID=A0A0R3SIJ8_HYMDI|nr:unnamed protein product [Hymenolepis diminuta]